MHRTFWLLIAAVLYFSVPVAARAQPPILTSGNAPGRTQSSPPIPQNRRNAPGGGAWGPRCETVDPVLAPDPLPAF